ncbi:MAG: hypothetical protein HFG05_06125 [Oscillibacter sp.]|nr:hypothetical protein [Oscillibacter sp.]
MDKRYALPLTAALGGAAACVLRLLQNHTGYEANTGLPISGNPAALALAALLVGLGVALAGMVRLLPEEEDPGPALPRDFSTENPGLLTLPMGGVFLLVLSGLCDLAEAASILPEGVVSSQHAIYGILRAGGLGFSLQGQFLLGVLTLAAAASLFPVLAGCRRRQGGPKHRAPAAITLAPVAALVVRLVLTYRIDSVNPSLTMYYVELLALVFLTLGFYRLSSFAFQAGRTRRFGFYAAGSLVLCAASMADGSAYLSSLLLYAGGALTLTGFLLLRLANGLEAEKDDGTIIGPAE